MEQIQKIHFIVGSRKISGTLQYPKDISTQCPAVIFIHGWTSSEKKHIQRGKPLVDNGYIVLTFDLGGHGISDGEIHRLTREDHLNDCIVAYDFLTSQPFVDKNRIGVVGSSYGGYMAALLSAKRNIWRLTLKSPANYIDEGFDAASSFDSVERARAEKYRSLTLKPDDNIALRAISEYKGKLLVIEAEKDEILPHMCVKNYANALSDQARLTYELMKDADHSSSKEIWNAEFVKIVTDWFIKENKHD